MITKPKISSVVPSQVPEFVREDYSTFIEFLKAYYEFVEQNYDSDIVKLRDIDTTLDSFVDYFKKEFAHNIPYTVVDERFLIQKLKDQYLAKGSEASFKLLFKLLFNKNVTVEYPSRQMLRASDGKWNQDVGIFARVNAGDPDMVVGKVVDVVTPNKIIRVQVDRRQYVEIEVNKVIEISPDVYEFFIDRRFFGNVNIADKLRYGEVFDATIQATTSTVTVEQRGKNFKVGELYELKNGDGAGSIVKVSSVNSEGGIVSLQFIKYGIGYDTDFTATIVPITSLNAVISGATLTIGGNAPSYNIAFNEKTDGFLEQGYINATDYNQATELETGGLAFDGTYAGEILREFFVDNKYTITDPEEPAILKITLGSLAKYPGYYSTNDGFLNDAIFIQDSKYYQAFSYVLKIDERIDAYKSAVKTMLHPSGMAMFGEYDIRNTFDLDITLEFALRVLFVQAQEEVFTSTSAIIDFHKALDDSITITDSLTGGYPGGEFKLEETPTDSATMLASVSTIDFGKLLEDSFSLTDSDSTDTTSATNGKFALTTGKALNNTHTLADNITTDDESFTPSDSGGNLWLSPYTTPYPSSGSYFANESGNYTTGESAFTG